MPEEKTVVVNQEYLKKLERIAQSATVYWLNSEAVNPAGLNAGTELFAALETLKPFQEK